MLNKQFGYLERMREFRIYLSFRCTGISVELNFLFENNWGNLMF